MLFEKQQYQSDCVNNIIKSLNGIDLKAIDTDLLADNIKQLNLRQTFPIVKNKRLDVLMETGTGKTFTYLKTIFELNRKLDHNHNKFIIVLPRVAIKQGVIQNIELTKEYFFNEYGKHLNYIDYPEDSLHSINYNFIQSKDLSILITTNSAFASDKNNINKKREGLFGFKNTWDGIAKQNPVVIIDEPHLLKGTETQKGLDRLTESLMIRFGATYPKNTKDNAYELSNVVYILDSISAFNDYLVKQIGVNTVFASSEQSGLHVQNIETKQSFEVVYDINKQLHKAIVRIGDDFGEKTQLDKYKGISVTKINANEIFLSNSYKLPSTSGNYSLSDNELKRMIQHSIELHFKKEQALFAQDIKALSLFFIPNIIDFRGENPIIKNYFEHYYQEIRQRYYANSTNAKYKKYLDNDYVDGELRVHDGYFSGDKGSKDNKEKAGINLILKDKEALLSFDTPLRFIFSVWALQEGWDNPNIFTLCKLSSTNKETSRRQQIGRGLRIAVNQQGKRLTYNYLAESEEAFYNINALDMVVSAQEIDFIYGIQGEIQEASFSIVGDVLSLNVLLNKGLDDSEAAQIFICLTQNNIIDADGKIQSNIIDFLNAHRDEFKRIDDERFAFIKSIFVRNNNESVLDKNKKPQRVRVRQAQWTKFKALWETINKKSKLVYKNVGEDDLIANIAEQFNQLKIQSKLDRVTKEVFITQEDQIDQVEDKTIANNATTNKGYFERHSITRFITEFSKKEQLPLNFTVKLFNKLRIANFNNDPEQAQRELSNIIENEIHAIIINYISYQFNETSVYANALQDKQGKLINSMNYTSLGQIINEALPLKDEYLYDKIVYDSSIEKESITKDSCRFDKQIIEVFAKLPKINIPLPRNKSYNPDFAYLISQGKQKQLFLIVETKGYEFEGDIPQEERQKINYANRFFMALQKKLPDIDIKYKTRLNERELGNILMELKK